MSWNGMDYMICTVAQPQKKLPVFKAGKWSWLAGSRISLYGHDAVRGTNGPVRGTEGPVTGNGPL